MNIRLLASISIFCGFFSEIRSDFNYDVGERVLSRIRDFTASVEGATSVSYLLITLGIVNSTKPERVAQVALFPISSVYHSFMRTIYVGDEQGNFIMSGHNDTSFSCPFFCLSAVDSNSHLIFNEYRVRDDGTLLTDQLLATYPYDCRTRPWYTAVKSSKKNLWSPLYQNSGSSQPVITFVQPIFNFHTNKPPQFTGALAADISLSQISEFLINSFTDEASTRVFIIDKQSYILLGDSGGSPTSEMVNGVPVR